MSFPLIIGAGLGGAALMWCCTRFRTNQATQRDRLIPLTAQAAMQAGPATQTPKKIQFYDTKVGSQYFHFCNFYESPVTYEGITYPCVEAAFQAAKSLDTRVRQQFAGLRSYGDGHDHMQGLSGKDAKERIGHKAFILGREINPLRHNWDNIKLDVMLELLRAKFSSNPLRQLLLDTKNAYLEEHAPSEFWGDKLDGSGQNNLGRLLMRIRQELGGQYGIVPKPALVGFRPSPQAPTAKATQRVAKTCLYRGCTKPVFVEPNGRVHDYCGRTHAQQAGAL